MCQETPEIQRFSSLAHLLQYVVCPQGKASGKANTLKGDHIMYAANTSNRLAAAAFSVIFSAAFFAYAIIPASPTLIA